MQTTSILNKILLPYIISAFLICPFYARSQPNTTKLVLPQGGMLSLSVDGDILNADVKFLLLGLVVQRKVSVDPAVLKAIYGAKQMIAIGARVFEDSGRSYFVLGVAKPSVAKPGAGFCGAGSEDLLFLIEWKMTSSAIFLRDQLEVQSCLKSIELLSDQGNELTAVLGKLDNPTSIQLTWLAHPKFRGETQRVTTRDGRFFVVQKS